MKNPRLTITQVTRYLTGGAGPFEGVPYARIGSLFHDICGELFARLETDGLFWRTVQEHLPADRSSDPALIEPASIPMRDFLYHELLPSTRFVKFSNLPPMAQHALWNALENLLDELVLIFLAARSKGMGIEKIMLGKEQTLRWLLHIENRVVLLTGRYDLLIFDPRYGSPHLIDFKLCGVQKDLASLTQAMLYSLMLAENHGIHAGATVMNLYPSRGNVTVSWQQIHAFRKPLFTLIQDVAARAFPAIFSRPPVVPGVCEVLSEVSHELSPDGFSARFSSPGLISSAKNDLALIESKLEEFGIAVSPFTGPGGPVVIGPTFILFRVIPGRGVKVASLANRDKDLQIALRLGSPPRIDEGPGYVQIEAPRRDPAVVKFSDLDLGSLKSGPGRFVLGVDIEGAVHWGDFSKSSTCHLLAGGQTGSGKSEFVRQLICSLAMSKRPEDLRLVLVDPKMTEYQDFNGSPFLLRPVVNHMDEAVEALRELVDEMESRYERFRKFKARDLDSYNSFGDRDRIPRLVVVFDEFADAMADKDLKKDLETSIKRLGAKARAAGIHLLIATQSPRKEVVTGLIKANLPCAVALRVANAVESKIIIDMSGAEKLLGRGDLLVKEGGNLVRLQSPLVSFHTVRKIMFPGPVRSVPGSSKLPAI
jgi:DNA segregation ATPase FtsK/SpoIIIE, S-DNA-T family